MNRFRPGGVWGFILRRLLLGILVLILVSVLVFLATQALPGDPARAILGRNADPASLAALRRQLHLDRPVADRPRMARAGSPGSAWVARNTRTETRISTTMPSSSRRRMNPHTPLGRNLFTAVLPSPR